MTGSGKPGKLSQYLPFVEPPFHFSASTHPGGFFSPVITGNAELHKFILYFGN